MQSILSELLESLGEVGSYRWMPYLLNSGFFHDRLPAFVDMIHSPQTTKYHLEAPEDEHLPSPGNNNVFNHTWLATVNADYLADRSGLSERDRETLILSALFHDIAKPSTYALGCGHKTDEESCRFLTDSFGSYRSRFPGISKEAIYLELDFQAQQHAESTGHGLDLGNRRNRGHDQEGARVLGLILSGEEDQDRVKLIAALIRDHINVGVFCKTKPNPTAYAKMSKRVYGRTDLLVMLFHADKAAGVYTQRACPSIAIKDQGVLCSINFLRQSFEGI